MKQKYTLEQRQELEEKLIKIKRATNLISEVIHVKHLTERWHRTLLEGQGAIKVSISKIESIIHKLNNQEVKNGNTR